MARQKTQTHKPPQPTAKKPPSTATKPAYPTKPKLSAAERAAYFGRREAAKVLHTVLRGDARRRAVASIKSLVLAPSVRNKKATFALVCQTLKYLPIIKEVIDTAAALNSKWRKQEELMYVLTYDTLFGQEISACGRGTAENYISLRKAALQSALAKILVKKNVKQVDDLLTEYQSADVRKPRYVRVNTLKLDVDSAVVELGKKCVVEKDDLVPDLLVLPPGVDLHDHPLVKSGNVFLQGKASSMAAVALSPQPGWEVLDACSAPGNKTVHLAALMRGQGKIVACELNAERVKLLHNTVKMAAATNVKVQHEDFLNINPEDPAYSKLRAILLDPSCSGSGTAAERLDHLLPSHMNIQADDPDVSRLTKLAAFQKKALKHALSFPSVERIVYSTCSIHQIENEDVVKSVLPVALNNGFQLETPFPQWDRRGLPIFEGSHHLLRMDPVKDQEGFFIALFVRKSKEQEESKTRVADCSLNQSKTLKKRKALRSLPCPSTRISKKWLLTLMSYHRLKTHGENNVNH